MFEVDTEWLDVRFFSPKDNGRYRVIASNLETRATYRDGKWSRDDVQAFKPKK